VWPNRIRPHLSGLRAKKCVHFERLNPVTTWLVTDGGNKVVPTDSFPVPLSDAELRAFNSRGCVFHDEAEALGVAMAHVRERLKALERETEKRKAALETLRKRLAELKAKAATT
jgi:hypothetical protein